MQIKKVIAFAVFILCCLFGCRISSPTHTEDFALLKHKDDWSHHYAYGSPSWDGFERFAGNPVYRGRKGFEWPVNGFLFNDPVSHQWFLYIGEYRENYAAEKSTDRKDMNCVIYVSGNKGKTWTKKADLFEAGTKAYGGISIEAPDVMVTYAEGKYHMIFDWVAANGTWENVDTAGLGYAVADKPEGPFRISEKPLKINTAYKLHPKLGKYSRMYAPMIVKRKNDWAILHMFDTQPARAWCLAIATSDKPEGPYSDSKIVLNVEAPNLHLPLQEFYPAFMYEDYMYFPATSVSLNRNYQSLYRAKTENLTDSSAYELVSGGSLFHGTQNSYEYAGIWGQTFTGFVDNDSLYIMYPSKDTANYGTINLAKTKWPELLGEKGFRLSSHEQNAFTYIKSIQSVDRIAADFSLQGGAHFIWDFNGLLDIEDGWGKFSLNKPAMRYKELVIGNAMWKLNVYDQSGAKAVIDSGAVHPGKDNDHTELIIQRDKDQFSITINNELCWKGILASEPGIVGLALDPHSYIAADRFELGSDPANGSIAYGFYDALLSAGNQDSDWTFTHDSSFLFSRGAISKKDSAIAKWIFEGKGFEWYAPKGPEYGKVHIFLDGHLSETVNLESTVTEKSAPRFIFHQLSPGKHHLFIQAVSKKMPLDCLLVFL
ncbi:MAG: hypothetical protein QM802_23060 [Agriterribacter sp.]